MPIVDTHCHVSQVYYEPVETLLFQMDRAGVDHAVFHERLEWRVARCAKSST